MNHTRNWKHWLRCAGIRAVKTAAQTMVALLPASTMITAVDWKVVLGTAALAAITSLCTSLAGLPEEATSPDVDQDCSGNHQDCSGNHQDWSEADQDNIGAGRG